MVSLKGEINVEGTVSKVGFIKEADVGRLKLPGQAYKKINKYKSL